MPSGPTMLADRYQLLRRLGAGPVGEVWEGRDLVLGRPVAVKVVHDHLVADDTFRARLRSLARDAAKVQHPNAVAVHDVDADGHFVVTELVEGPSARRLLAEQGTLSPEAAMRLVAGACSALSAAHAVGVLHRGLKPENLLIAPGGGVKLTDFCLAKAGPDPGLAAVRYLAPEELATGQVDDRSDLYALGCCLYELLCGRPPFDGPTPFAVASAHVNERPRRPSSIRPDIPQPLEQVIARALAKQPNNRFQTPAELRQALHRAGEPPATPNPATPNPGTPKPQPRDSGAPAREGSPAGEGAPAAVHSPPPATTPASTSAPARTPASIPTPAAAPTPASAPVRGPVPAGGGTPPERRRLVAALVAVGLLAGSVAVLTATRPSPGTPASTAAATSAPAAKRPASAVSPATSSTQLVPVVAGATRDEATERLRQAGLPLGTVRRIRDGGVPGGHAVGTKPMAGERLRPGERVTLVLSTGASPTSVADLIALIDANPRAAGTRAPAFRKRLARLDALNGRRRQTELADLLRIARAGAANGDFSFSFSAAAVRVLDRLV